MEKLKVQLAQHYNIYYHNIKQYENNTDLTKRYMEKIMNIEKMNGHLEKFFPTSWFNLFYPTSQASGSSFQALNFFFSKVSHVNDLLEFFEALGILDCFLQM